MILSNRLTVAIYFISFFIAVLFSVNAQAQIQFEQVVPLPPAPQNTEEFTAVSYSAIAYADVDGDMDQDVLITGDAHFGSVSELYINDGSGNFTKASNTPFIGVKRGSVAFADIDGDSDQDVLISGFISGPYSYTRLYTNDGDGNFSLVEDTYFRGVEKSCIAFADVDGDQDQDVLISGYFTLYDSPSIVLYFNDGNGNFTPSSPSTFTSVVDGSISFADIDGDLDQDVLITGISGLIGVTRLYTNDGSGNFSLVSNTPFTDVSRSAIAFGDIDGDLDQDVIITGNSSQGYIAELYANDGIGNFTMVDNTIFTGVTFGSVAFADIDGDQDQDVLITGNSDSEVTAKLYTNDGYGNFILSASAPFTGVAYGSIAFADIDGDLDQDVLITGDPDNYYQISELYMNDGTGTFSKVSKSTLNGVLHGSVAFADIDGDLDQDVLITGSSNSGYISELYTNDGFGNFTVVANTPFTGVRQSAIAFADIDGDMDQDVMITGYIGVNNHISELYINDGSGNFSLVPNTTFPGMYNGAVVFSDMDGDLDLDLLMAGRIESFGEIANIYTNDGNGNFTLMENMPFTQTTVSAMTLADIDGDMDQDVLITGSTFSGASAELYSNDGNGILTLVENTPFIGLYDTNSIAFADIDGDMDQDVLFVGAYNGYSRTAKLYTNDGSGNFVFVPNTPFTKVSGGVVAFGDIDGDLDQDVLITGRSATTSNISELYSNDGNGNFSLVDDTPFTQVAGGSTYFADIDGDIDLDLFIAGQSQLGLVSNLYRNLTPQNCGIAAECKFFALALDSSGNAILQPSDINDGSLVGCGPPTLTISRSEFTCVDVGTHIIELTVSDSTGNFEVCTAEVTILAGVACFDCAGVVNGTATIDDCGLCSGGNTGLEPNASCTDCEGIVNGDALPGAICSDGVNTGFYNSSCECEIILVGNLEGTFGNLLACGSRNMTIAAYNSESPENNEEFIVSVNEDGTFTTPELVVGMYTILVSVDGYLSQLYSDVIIESGTQILNIPYIAAGDLNSNNNINVTDFSIMVTVFGSSQGLPNFNNKADLNCDEVINVVDFSILVLSFGLQGDNPPQ